MSYRTGGTGWQLSEAHASRAGVTGQNTPGGELRPSDKRQWRQGRRAFRAQDPYVERDQARLLHRHDFIYDAEHDHYTCPAGAKLTKAKRRANHTEDFDSTAT